MVEWKSAWEKEKKRARKSAQKAAPTASKFPQAYFSPQESQTQFVNNFSLAQTQLIGKPSRTHFLDAAAMV